MLAPQQRTVPSARSAQLWEPPAAIAVAVPGATLVVAFRPGFDEIGISGTVAGEGPVVVEAIAEQVLRAIVEDFVVEAGEGRVSFSCVMRRTPR